MLQDHPSLEAEEDPFLEEEVAEVALPFQALEAEEDLQMVEEAESHRKEVAVVEECVVLIVVLQTGQQPGSPSNRKNNKKKNVCQI